MEYTWNYNSYIENIRFLAVVCAALAAAGIVCMFFHYVGKNHELLKYGSFTPVAALAIFVIMSIYELTVMLSDGYVDDYYPKGSVGY